MVGLNRCVSKVNFGLLVFPSALQFLTKHGFGEPSGERVTQRFLSPSHPTSRVSPEGPTSESNRTLPTVFSPPPPPATSAKRAAYVRPSVFACHPFHRLQRGGGYETLTSCQRSVWDGGR